MRIHAQFIAIALAALAAGCSKASRGPSPLTHIDVGGAKAVVAVLSDAEHAHAILAIRPDGTVAEAAMTGNALPAYIGPEVDGPTWVPQVAPWAFIRLATGNAVMGFRSLDPGAGYLMYARLGAFVDAATGDVVSLPGSLILPPVWPGKQPAAQEGPPGFLWLFYAGDYLNDSVVRGQDLARGQDPTTKGENGSGLFRSLGLVKGMAVDDDGNLAWRDDRDGSVHVATFASQADMTLAPGTYGLPWRGPDGKLHVTRASEGSTELLRLEIAADQVTPILLTSWQGETTIEGWPVQAEGRTCFVGEASVLVFEALEQPPATVPLDFEWATWAPSAGAIWFEAWDSDGAVGRLVRWTPADSTDVLPAGAYSFEVPAQPGLPKLEVAPVDGESAFFLARRASDGASTLRRAHADGTVEDLPLPFSPTDIVGGPMQ